LGKKLDFDPVEDKFMQRFDENGNFVNIPVIEELEQLDPQFSYYTSSCPDYKDGCKRKNESKLES
jgi:hypothetical protein